MTWEEFKSWLNRDVDMSDPTIAAGVAVFFLGFVIGSILILEHKSPWHVLLGTFIQPIVPQI